MKNIENENVKIFTTLANIKPTLSRKNILKH